MKPSFAVGETRRELPSGLAAETPLITVAWRALRSERQRSSALLRDIEHETRKTDEALGRIAETAWRLQRSAAEQAAVAEASRSVAAILASVGVHAVAPAGEPYTLELMEIFDNIAQRRVAGIAKPYIADVVAPAILCRGGVLRMGKAVIAFPEE